MTEKTLNYFGEGPDEALTPNPAGEEPANPETHSPSTGGEKELSEKITNPRWYRAEWFTGI